MPELEPLYTADEMRSAEAGHDVDQLMERAGRAVAEFVLHEFDEARAVTVVCGPGNNGGDGRVAARILREAEREVRVVEAKPEDEEKDLGDPELIVDALFGTGFSGEPRPGAARLIEQMNAADDDIAVDIGLDHEQTEHARPTTEILQHVPLREPADTKYTAGSVLVVGGSPGLTGAASLAAMAAFRADAGYVAVAAPRGSLPVLEARPVEAGQGAP